MNAAARAAVRPAVSLEADGPVIRSESADMNKLERWEEADGEVRWMRVDRIPVAVEAGGRQGLVVVATDLTEAVENEQALARANEGLKQFAYVASHDLQEPLRKIGTFVDILLDGVATGNADDVAYSTVVIKDSARRASSLIKDLLSWSRLTNRPLDRQPLPFAAVVRDVVHDIRAARPGDDAEVVEDMIDVLVSADATHARQLIENLVVNALKYRHPDRRPRLVLRLHRAGNGRLQFEIEDNGIGFDPAKAAMIFEPFRRLHSERDYTGTGVGLAICARVCERHGWSIEAFGRPGQGATFRVDLGTGGVAPPARETVDDTSASRTIATRKGRRKRDR
jgi:signal transduction histidine kinase